MSLTNIGNVPIGDGPIDFISPALRKLYGGNVIKRIALRFHVSTKTAVNWLNGHTCPADFDAWAEQHRDDIKRHIAELERDRQWLDTYLSRNGRKKPSPSCSERLGSASIAAASV